MLQKETIRSQQYVYQLSEINAIVGAYICFSYVLLLWGNKGLMIDIKELFCNQKNKKGQVWIILSRKLKKDWSPLLHKLRSVSLTSSDINLKQWRDCLLAVHLLAKRHEGPAICDSICELYALLILILFY